ncbi:MAG: hypothetical protein JNM51_00995, partial [Bacteroidia bacterium]|nr:hypothetical protein [Bacteroidia bacterium]
PKTNPPKKEEPKKEVVKQEPKKEPEVVKPVSTAVLKEEPKKAVAVEEESDVIVDAKTNPSAPAKPKKAKDPKACRQACYGSGESDLNDFFRDKIVLTKKMRKDEVDLKLQLNVDGTVKKVIVLGDNAELNKLVEEVAKNMVWNASVKNGLTIKSEVRMKLKFDKELKGLKANDLMVNPRLGPKCMTCASDSELFPN